MRKCYALFSLVFFTPLLTHADELPPPLPPPDVSSLLEINESNQSVPAFPPVVERQPVEDAELMLPSLDELIPPTEDEPPVDDVESGGEANITSPGIDKPAPTKPEEMPPVEEIKSGKDVEVSLPETVEPTRKKSDLGPPVFILESGEAVEITDGKGTTPEVIVEPCPCDVPAMTVEPLTLEGLAGQVDALKRKITVSTGNENFNLIVGGKVTGDFLYSTTRPEAPGTPFFLFPDSVVGFSSDTFDAHARQSSIFGFVTGPEIGNFQTSGLFLANFYDVSLIEDKYGFLPLEAWVDLRNEDWRFAAGLQFDIFNPLTPTVLPFSLLIGSGNTGNAYRGQARVVRYLNVSDQSQVTIQAGISEPVSTFFDSANQLIVEDNGWPNVESRVAWGMGPAIDGPFGFVVRPIEVGLSGVIGQLRNTDVGNAVRVVTDVWGMGADARVALSERFGFKVEAYLGQGLGTYGGSILSNVNPVTFAGLRSAGGFGEVYYYLCPKTLHTHVGYGIDDPVNGDLGLAQPLRNETYFANLIWDVNPALRLGLELSYRQTAYSPLLQDNQGVTVHSQVQFTF